MSSTWFCALLLAAALSLPACAPHISAAAARSSDTRVATPEPIRPSTATPLPRGKRPIYIVDTRDGDMASTIWIVDPDTARLVGSIGARYDPEIAFSPDGSRLYIADSYRSRVIRGESHDVVSVYDAATGGLLHDDVEIPNRLLYKLFPNPHPFTFLSRDGKRLYVGRYGDPDIHALRMTVLGADNFRELATYPHPCSGFELWPLQDGRLACVQQSELRLVEPLKGGVTETLSLPEAVAATALAPVDDRLFILSRNSQATVVDLTTARPVPRTTDLPVLAGSSMWLDQAAVSRDGARLYVAYETGEPRGSGLANEIWAFDTGTWTRVGVFKPARPAFHIAVSNDGMQLYAVNPFAKSLSIFDTATFRETAVMQDLGRTPAYIVVPPTP